MDTNFTEEEWESLPLDDKQELQGVTVHVEGEEYIYAGYPDYEWKRRYEECFDCGGLMHWCSCCRTYSQNCCVDYGTCLCN